MTNAPVRNEHEPGGVATEAGASCPREAGIQAGVRLSPPLPFASCEEIRLIVGMNLNHKWTRMNTNYRNDGSCFLQKLERDRSLCRRTRCCAFFNIVCDL